jgi:hypothetical protein
MKLYSSFQVQDIRVISDEVIELFTTLAKLWYATAFHARGMEKKRKCSSSGLSCAA